MANRPVFTRIARFFKLIYLKLFRINDSPQRIALGFGLGVFTGVLPGTGPLAALGLALILRVNRASALLGSVLTNTWLSIPVFMLSIKAGSAVTRASYQTLKGEWSLLVKDFHWKTLFDIGAYKILGPIIVGYAAVSVAIGAVAYVATLAILKYYKRDRGLAR